MTLSPAPGSASLAISHTAAYAVLLPSGRSRKKASSEANDHLAQSDTLAAHDRNLHT